MPPALLTKLAKIIVSKRHPKTTPNNHPRNKFDEVHESIASLFWDLLTCNKFQKFWDTRGLLTQRGDSMLNICQHFGWSTAHVFYGESLTLLTLYFIAKKFPYSWTTSIKEHFLIQISHDGLKSCLEEHFHFFAPLIS